MKDLTWFGLIEVVGTSSRFVKKNVEGDGYRFECDPDAFSLSITEIIPVSYTHLTLPTNREV